MGEYLLNPLTPQRCQYLHITPHVLGTYLESSRTTFGSLFQSLSCCVGTVMLGSKIDKLLVQIVPQVPVVL